MKPRCRSEWITPAHSGALAPARNVHARDSVSPVVRNVRRPSRWYAARATRGTTPSPSPRPSSSSARSSGSSCAASASSCRQTPIASTTVGHRAPRARRPGSSWSSPMLTTASTGFVGEEERGREQLALVVGELGAVERRAVAEHCRPPAPAPRSRPRATCRPWPPAAAGRGGPRPTPGRRAPARARACRGRTRGRRRPAPTGPRTRRST